MDMFNGRGGEDGYGINVPEGAPRFPGDTGVIGAGYPHEEERDEKGNLNLTNKFLRDLFKAEPRKYYRTPALNEKLYLHFKGFDRVQNLGQFINLKCLYFEGNGCSSTLGLETNTRLFSLMMHENVIEKMEGLTTLVNLRTLNLSDNCIKRIEGLSGCVHLDTLQLKRNRIGNDGLDDVRGLLECKSLCNLDVAENRIDDKNVVEEIWQQLPELKVLYSQGNPYCKEVSSYRKTMIAKLPPLKYLDDRPVFEEDRRRAEAYARGGIEAEREEMKAIKKEKEDKHWANHEAFK
jgi:dynein assembly factor 1